MAATLLQLRDELVLRTGLNNNPKFPPLRLNRILNHSARYVQTQLNGLGMKKWETSIATGTLAAGTFATASTKTFAVSVLTGMLESPASIRFIETTDGSTGKGLAYPIDENVFLEQLSNTYLLPTLAKPIFARISGNIHLAPATITGGTVHYYKCITDLSGDTDITEIPTEFEDFILQKAIIEIETDLNKEQNKENKVQVLEANLKTVYEKFNGKQVEKNRSSMNDNAKLQ
jgi:hypothetical protein